ncbi:MAG: Calx-beta domain-containing protein [Fuerstiella sp.]
MSMSILRALLNRSRQLCSRTSRRRHADIVSRLQLLETRALLAPVTIMLTPARDNSIFSENINSAGADDGLFSGRTNNGNVRRALLQFDVVNAGIPNGATITDVSLQLRVSQGFGSHSFALHKFSNDWGEGTSTGTQGGGGRGGAPTANDATWQHRFFPGTTWTNPGGDFDGPASASKQVLGTGKYTWTAQGLIDDVNAWIATPANNFGWTLLGAETTAHSARRFDSKEHSTPGNRPALSITYDVAATPEITIADAAGVVEGGTAVFTVTLSETSGNAVTVNYSTANGTAGAADYTAQLNQTLTFNPGQTQKTIAIVTVDDSSHEQTETFTVQLANPNGATLGTAQGTGTIVDNDAAGDVDGDNDFDANDSFLIHLVKLSGTNAQIDQSKGSSPFTAAGIRAAINQLGAPADVDGDGDFDANDSFLIHLVKLSGTDVQIDQSKGSSSLNAVQIRANVNGLGGGSTTSSEAGKGSEVLQSVFARTENGDNAGPTNTPRARGPAPVLDLAAENLFANVGADENSELTNQVGVTPSDSVSEFAGQEFRQWIDAI